MAFTILSRADLPRDTGIFEYIGAEHGSPDISFIWVDMPLGEGVRLHQHPYKEIFIIQSGATPLQKVDIHLSPRFITDWLGD